MSTVEREQRGTDVSPRLFGIGLAILRIFMGLVLLANGVAKVFSADGDVTIRLGPYVANLVDREAARSILASNGGGSELPLVPAITNNLLLPAWPLLQWVVTLTELGVGALLIVGLFTRGAALVGLLFQLSLALVYFSSNRWMFEQPHEYVPLFILALVPAGLVWGLDGRLGRARWPS
ncbi:MAG: DoxX family protein [Actinomycetota bacterium]|nr:DoxX family protein [Actinomycetota bacterium]